MSDVPVTSDHVRVVEYRRSGGGYRTSAREGAFLHVAAKTTWSIRDAPPIALALGIAGTMWFFAARALARGQPVDALLVAIFATIVTGMLASVVHGVFVRWRVQLDPLWLRIGTRRHPSRAIADWLVSAVGGEGDAHQLEAILRDGTRIRVLWRVPEQDARAVETMARTVLRGARA